MLINLRQLLSNGLKLIQPSVSKGQPVFHINGTYLTGSRVP